MNDKYVSLHSHHMSDRDLRILNAMKCLRAVRTLMPFASVVDFGCGIGAWLVAARRLGAERVLGIEGAWITQAPHLLEDAQLMVADLAADRLMFKRSFDLCLSVEVGEHLPAASADLFCENLVNAANLLVFSAAITGQTGVNHINEQPPRYWVDKFWDRGFVPLEIIRPVIINEPEMYSWLRQNLMVFVNYDHLHMHTQLVRFAMPRQHFYVRYQAM